MVRGKRLRSLVNPGVTFLFLCHYYNSVKKLNVSDPAVSTELDGHERIRGGPHLSGTQSSIMGDVYHICTDGP